ncbi:MAG: hypothetical protein IT285_01455 [Bdellovibrionales bacterium]|nr:hypothetical protein [Bdellovibrionales bacterium]
MARRSEQSRGGGSGGVGYLTVILLVLFALISQQTGGLKRALLAFDSGGFQKVAGRIPASG